MKIRGIYTEVPGLETLYAVKDKDGKFDIQAEISDEQIQTIIEEVSAQADEMCIRDSLRDAGEAHACWIII